MISLSGYLPRSGEARLAIVDSYSENTSSTFEVLLFALWVIGGLPSALYLGLRLRRAD
jgi:hypothetical protein